MTPPEHDPSVEHEPHLSRQPLEEDASEESAARILIRSQSSEDDGVEHSVWDEPALAPHVSAAMPEDAATFSRWLDEKVRGTGRAKSWAVTFVLILLAGPWAIIGTLLSGGQGAAAVAMVVVFGPVMEEIMKVSAALWVVEKRPYLFRSPFQIVICGLASGLAFAAVENVLYLTVYIQDPSPEMIAWRWTVCVALHAGCSLIASLGLVRIWSHTMQTRRRSELTQGILLLATAMVVHGLYNAGAVLLSAMDFFA